MEIKLEIPLKRISDMLCSALESSCGSHYWVQITAEVKPDKLTFHCMDGHVFPHIDYPLNEGGSIVIQDIEDESHAPFVLDIDAIQKGLAIMAEKEPRHFGDFLSENDDATTGDVFLQCCVFGETLYG
jgi:hypothetical protein